MNSPTNTQYMPSRALGGSLPAHNAPTCSHAVEFYGDREAFLDSLADYVRSAIQSGGACLIIATAPNRQALAQRLRQAGVNLARAVQNSQYLLLDADATLAGFMIDGRPDRQRFFATIEPHLLHARTSLGPEVRFPVAFGEMVALLCDQGNYEGAVRLEQLWNEIAQKHSFSLRCAYPTDSFIQNPQGPEYLNKICAEHSHVLSS